MRVGLRKCDTVVHFEAREQGKGITTTIITNVPVDRGGWKRGVLALRLCHSRAGVKDTQNVNVVGNYWLIMVPQGSLWAHMGSRWAKMGS